MYEYTVEEGENGPLFSFTNQFEITYRVLLQQFPTDIPNFQEAYSVSAYPLNNNRPRRADPRIGLTIYHMLTEFLSGNPESILMYVCDNDDGLAEQRQKKFSGWYQKYTEGRHRLCKFNTSDDNAPAYYSAFIFDPETYSEEILIQTYQAELDFINGQKD